MLLKAIFLVLSLVVATQGQAPGESIGLSDAVYAGTVCQNGCSWNTSELYNIGRVPEANDIVDLKPQNTDQSTFAITINVDVPVTIRGFNFGASGSSGLNFVLNIKSGNTFTVTTDTVRFGARSTVNVEQGATLSIGGQTTVNGAMNVAGTASFGGSKPALTVTTTTPLNPLNIVSPSLVLNGGLITAPQGVLIDNYATNLARTPSLTGVGNITSGEVQISGNFKPGSDDNTPGNIYIDGSVRLTSQARIYFNIKNKDEFDHVYITNVINIDGKLLMSPIGGFEPLKGQRFFIMNHTEMIGGFDSVSGSGFTSLFNDKWSIRPDQQNTIVVWNSASSLVASVMVVLVCLVASLL